MAPLFFRAKSCLFWLGFLFSIGCADGLIIPDNIAGQIDPTGLGDPLLEEAWHLHNTGANGLSGLPGNSGIDLNMSQVYEQGTRGQGIRVAVIDTGVEKLHPDLRQNVSPDSRNLIENSNDPTNFSGGGHGTYVSGIIAANDDNGIGSRGIAPDAEIVGYRAGVGSDSLGLSPSAVLLAYEASRSNHVYNMSFGYDAPQDQLIDPDELLVQEKLVRESQNGRGALLVKAAGNSMYFVPENTKNIDLRVYSAQHDAIQTYPHIVAVGAVNAQGTKASYSQMGANLWISAPSGEQLNFGKEIQQSNPLNIPAWFFLPSILTTDLSGCEQGYATNPTEKIEIGDRIYPLNEFDSQSTSNSNCDYTSSMNGTSAAAPMVAGVAALVYSVNPLFTWREVKHILAKSARKIDDTSTYKTFTDLYYLSIAPLKNLNLSRLLYFDLGWITNAAGNHFHNAYGFGMSDATVAVELARTLSPGFLKASLNSATKSATPNISIPIRTVTPGTEHIASVDDLGSLSFSASDFQNKIILGTEAVVIHVTVDHDRGGDIGIDITSPSGTRSILQYVNNSFGAKPMVSNMRFLSNAFYEESPIGTWSIRAYDINSDRVANAARLVNWKIQVRAYEK